MIVIIMMITELQPICQTFCQFHDVYSINAILNAQYKHSINTCAKASKTIIEFYMLGLSCLYIMVATPGYAPVNIMPHDSTTPSQAV